MYDQKTKTITSRALKRDRHLYISDQGDITDLNTTIWRGDKTARRWVKINIMAGRPKFTLITRADSLRLDKNDLLVKTGTRVDRISGEAFSEAHESMRRPSGPSTTIDGWRAENRTAMKALAASMSRDMALPILHTVSIGPHGSNTVQAYATDRFTATSAILDTVSKPVQFTSIVHGTIIRELAVAPAWHLTVWEDHSMAEFCDTGVRIQRRNVIGTYPEVHSLFPEGESEHQATLTVNPAPLARVLRGLHASYSFPAGLSVDGRLAADGSGTLKPEGMIEANTVGEPKTWVGFNAGYMARLLRSVTDLGQVRIAWSPDWKPIQVWVSDRIGMIIMPTRDGGDSFPVSDEIEVS